MRYIFSIMKLNYPHYIIIKAIKKSEALSNELKKFTKKCVEKIAGAKWFTVLDSRFIQDKND